MLRPSSSKRPTWFRRSCRSSTPSSAASRPSEVSSSEDAAARVAAMSPLAPVLMVQGTASSAGKSTMVAGLCRLLSRQGLRVAPFKAQNMSNNAAVCRDGGEIGRAQFAQAVAANIEPTVDMNPILLKPQDGACQVVVRGQVHGVQTAAEYFGPRRGDLWPVVVDALDSL